MSFHFVSASSAIILILLSCVRAETHTITFTNKCGAFTVRQGPTLFLMLSIGSDDLALLFIKPTLVENNQVVSTGAPVTTNGPIISAVAYLQTGSCGLNGENC